MLQLVGKTVVVDALLHHLDFVAKEDGAERLLDDGPENGHGGADDGEVKFEAGEDDESWRPPGVVDVGRGCAFGFDDAMESPY